MAGLPCLPDGCSWGDEPIAKIHAGVKVWLAAGRHGLLGAGRFRLLEAVRSTGSLKEAAKRVGICEKTAHRVVRRMEKLIGKRLVISERGGSSGGTSRLTTAARTLMEQYRELVEKARSIGGQG